MALNCDTNRDLTPTVFEDHGREMLRYQLHEQDAPDDPRRSIAVAEQGLLRYHISRERDICALESRAEQNEHDIYTTRETTKRDLRQLQGQMEQLQKQVETIEIGKFLALRRGSHEEYDHVAPPPDMIENFSEAAIADAYSIEAGNYERAAAKLRAQAHRFNSSLLQHSMKFLDGPGDANENTAVSIRPEFSCCGNVFDSVDEMLGHIKVAHSEHFTAEVMQHRREHSPGLTSQRVHSQTPSLEEKTSGIPNREIVIFEANPASATDPPNNTPWKPLSVLQMPAAKRVSITNVDTFTFDFLVSQFGGQEWSPGFYFVPGSDLFPGEAYWILDAEFEPFLPTEPGHHGAKLTAFFNTTSSKGGPEESNYMKTPVFVRRSGAEGYTYMGSYSQMRFSDRIDYDRLMEQVPESVRQIWAEQLADRGRPEWVTEQLMQHFWPKPVYEGPIPLMRATTAPDIDNSAAPECRVRCALAEYALELAEWENEARMKVVHLTAKNLMDSFEKADADEEPGLRLWLEYLECVGYDEGFYDFLIRLKYNPQLQRTPDIPANKDDRKVHASKTAADQARAKNKDNAFDKEKSLPEKSAVGHTKGKSGTSEVSRDIRVASQDIWTSRHSKKLLDHIDGRQAKGRRRVAPHARQ